MNNGLGPGKAFERNATFPKVTKIHPPRHIIRHTSACESSIMRNKIMRKRLRLADFSKGCDSSRGLSINSDFPFIILYVCGFSGGFSRPKALNLNNLCEPEGFIKNVRNTRVELFMNKLCAASYARGRFNK